MKQLRLGQCISSVPGFAPRASVSVVCLGPSLGSFGHGLFAWFFGTTLALLFQVLLICMSCMTFSYSCPLDLGLLACISVHCCPDAGLSYGTCSLVSRGFMPPLPGTSHHMYTLSTKYILNHFMPFILNIQRYLGGKWI